MQICKVVCISALDLLTAPGTNFDEAGIPFRNLTPVRRLLQVTELGLFDIAY